VIISPRADFSWRKHLCDTGSLSTPAANIGTLAANVKLRHNVATTGLLGIIPRHCARLSASHGMHINGQRPAEIVTAWN